MWYVAREGGRERRNVGRKADKCNLRVYSIGVMSWESGYECSCENIIDR